MGKTYLIKDNNINKEVLYKLLYEYLGIDNQKVIEIVVKNKKEFLKLDEGLRCYERLTGGLQLYNFEKIYNEVINLKNKKDNRDIRLMPEPEKIENPI